MQQVLKLIGNQDPQWEAAQENEDHCIDTRLLGREDIYWDVDGSDEQTSFVDHDGEEHPLHYVNAGHIPLPAAVREVTGNAATVADGIRYLAEQSVPSAGTGSAMAADTVLTLTAVMTDTARQTTIDNQKKDLGGHVLTIQFEAALDIYPIQKIEIAGFFNGSLVIDLNGITVTAAAAIACLFHIRDCHCKTELKSGTLVYASAVNAVLAERCPCLYLTSLAFSGTSTSYAVHATDCDGKLTGCTAAVGKALQIDGMISGYCVEQAQANSTSAVGTHNADNTAHSQLFAAKEAAGSVAAHNTNAEAHADIRSAVSSTGQSAANALSAHNTNAEAHADIRQAVSAAQNAAEQAAGSVAAHNTNAEAHADIRQAIANERVSTTYDASTGSWKREWPDGWIEYRFTQNISSQNMHVDLPVTMANADYFICGNSYVQQYGRYVSCFSKTASGFVCYTGDNETFNSATVEFFVSGKKAAS